MLTLAAFVDSVSAPVKDPSAVKVNDVAAASPSTVEANQTSSAVPVATDPQSSVVVGPAPPFVAVTSNADTVKIPDHSCAIAAERDGPVAQVIVIRSPACKAVVIGARYSATRFVDVCVSCATLSCVYVLPRESTTLDGSTPVFHPTASRTLLPSETPPAGTVRTSVVFVALRCFLSIVWMSTPDNAGTP